MSTSSLADVPVAEARERRDDVLASLRKETGGSKVADILTDAFPTGNVGVPVYIAVGRYAGQRAVIMIEAYGPEGGAMDHKRVWVLSMDGTPLYSSSAR